MTTETKFDVLIVGAGFAGCVVARELANAGRKVQIVEKRPHIAGNAYDSVDAHGHLIHDYGPHIFHTNSEMVIRWLSQFTHWRFYEHRVLAKVGAQYLPIPINRQTLNQLYGLELDEAGAADYLVKVREPRETNKTSEDVVLSSVGQDLCDKFFRGYTKKQWGLDLSELSAGVAARIPTRTNDDDRYFTDTYQLMPDKGYTAMFQNMLDHPLIDVSLSYDFAVQRPNLSWNTLIYTGPIDQFYNYQFGKLPYRSIQFEHSHQDVDQLQSVGTVNYPNDHAYTRITEFKHLTGSQAKGTSYVYEFPSSEGDPYYPIPRQENEALFKQYSALAEKETSVHFVGRLAQYRYYNMDQVVAAALSLSKKIT
jgi:UDP-galactopyranose mutase